MRAVAPVTIRTEVSPSEEDPTDARASARVPSEERSHPRSSPPFPLPRVQWVPSGCFEYTSEGRLFPRYRLGLRGSVRRLSVLSTRYSAARPRPSPKRSFL